MSTSVVAVFHARGHLIDSGLLSDALEAVHAVDGHYRVMRLEIGRERLDESELELEVTAPGERAFERVRADLMSLGLSETETVDVGLAEVETDGVAPEGFYSTTGLTTDVRIDGSWVRVARQRMDAVVLVDGRRAECVMLRDLVKGQHVAVGFGGIRVQPSATRTLQDGGGGPSLHAVGRERRLAAQVVEVAREWRRVRQAGRRVVVVAGPVVVHAGAAPTLAAILRAGQVDALLAGNALAVHDIEAALYGTSLGVDLATGAPAVHGHVHHMRAINVVRRAGSIGQAVAAGELKSGILHACVAAGVPFCLAGSIRDDGPLPDTDTDMIAAQACYAAALENAGLVVVLGSILHGVGAANMVPAEVTTVCVDLDPRAVGMLGDRGPAHNKGVVTDVGAFLTALAGQLGVAVG